MKALGSPCDETSCFPCSVVLTTVIGYCLFISLSTFLFPLTKRCFMSWASRSRSSHIVITEIPTHRPSCPPVIQRIHEARTSERATHRPSCRPVLQRIHVVQASERATCYTNRLHEGPIHRTSCQPVIQTNPQWPQENLPIQIHCLTYQLTGRADPRVVSNIFTYSYSDYFAQRTFWTSLNVTQCNMFHFTHDMCHMLHCVTFREVQKVLWAK